MSDLLPLHQHNPQEQFSNRATAHDQLIQDWQQLYHQWPDRLPIQQVVQSYCTVLYLAAQKAVVGNLDSI